MEKHKNKLFLAGIILLAVLAVYANKRTKPTFHQGVDEPANLTPNIQHPAPTVDFPRYINDPNAKG